MGAVNDGLWMQFGSGGGVRFFDYAWPMLVRHEQQPSFDPINLLHFLLHLYHSFESPLITLGKWFSANIIDRNV